MGNKSEFLSENILYKGCNKINSVVELNGKKRDMRAETKMEEKRYTNKDLQAEQLKTIKLFYERGILSEEQYEYEVGVLTSKIKTDDGRDGNF